MKSTSTRAPARPPGRWRLARSQSTPACRQRGRSCEPCSATTPGSADSQLQDITLSTIPATVGSIRVVHTAKRKGREWIYGTPKSEASSDRVVPLAPWLADELRQYLTETHPFSATNTQGMKHIPHAPVFPGRRNRYKFDWAKPVHAGSLH